MYYYYYATQVMHHMGGDVWDQWNPRMRDLLIGMQDKGDGQNKADQKGSFDPKGWAFGEQFGRLGQTALCVLTLEVYYRYPPLSQKKEEPKEEKPKEGNAKEDGEQSTKSSLAAVIKALQSNQQSDRAEAANQLARMGKDGKKASQPLLRAMLASFPTNKEVFLDALEKINPDIHKPVVSIMLDPGEKEKAIQQLGELGPRGTGALPVLLPTYTAGFTELRELASGKKNSTTNYRLLGTTLEAMIRIAPSDDAVIKAVVDIIAFNDRQGGQYTQNVKAKAFARVQDMDIDPDVLVSALTQCLNDQQSVQSAILELARLGGAAKAAIPTLDKLRTSSSNKVVREAALAALKNIKEK
jgi:hypothetical protein